MSGSKCFSAALLLAGAMAAPSDDFDLSGFKLTTPYSKEGFFGAASSRGLDSNAEVYNTMCAVDQSEYAGLPIDGGFEDEFFYSEDDGAMVFRVELDGKAAGSGSSNWRSELRELRDFDVPTCTTEEANWGPEGIHALHATLRVVEVSPEDPQTVICKIEAEGSSKNLVKLQYDGPNLPLRAIVNEDPVLGNPFSLTFPLIPNTDMFSYVVTVVDGTLTVSVSQDGVTHSESLTFGEGISELWNDFPCYFRAGNNPQAATDLGGAFEVHYYRLETAHTADPNAVVEEEVPEVPDAVVEA